jgi:poly(A) polymerase
LNFAEHLHSNPIFKIISSVAQKQQKECFVIGGYVRDLLLKRSQKKDIDIVCLGSGIELAEAIAAELGDKVQVAVFRNFGTASIHFDGLDLEFVGARKESYNRDSRKPIVENGTLEEDQNRRDFTINAMGISLNESNFGDLIDPFDGVNDLKKRILKTPLEPDVTFSDDPLRMLRAMRFATQLNFDIEPETFASIQRMAERISIVSMERITVEINKIIMADVPSYGFKLLYHSGLLQKLFPELCALQGVETQDGKGHKDNFYHTLQVLDNASKRTDDLWIRWAAILHDIAKPATKRFHPKIGWSFHGHEELGSRWVPGIFKKFKLPLGEQMRSVKNVVRLHLRPIALAKEGVSDSAIRRLLFEAGPDLEALMILCRADITSKDPVRVKRYLGNFDKVEAQLYEVEARDKIRSFQPIITGEIIMETFGLSPSKEVGNIKFTIREAILDNILENDFETGFDFMLKTAAEMNLQPIRTKAEILAFINQKEPIQ